MLKKLSVAVESLVHASTEMEKKLPKLIGEAVSMNVWNDEKETEVDVSLQY
jgi:hypothetical protein